jgi:hypothetical protein
MSRKNWTLDPRNPRPHRGNFPVDIAPFIKCARCRRITSAYTDKDGTLRTVSSHRVSCVAGGTGSPV